MKKRISIFASLLLGLSSSALGCQRYKYQLDLTLHVAPGQQRTINVHELMEKSVRLLYTNEKYLGMFNTARWPQVVYTAQAAIPFNTIGFVMRDQQNIEEFLVVHVITEPAMP